MSKKTAANTNDQAIENVPVIATEPMTEPAPVVETAEPESEVQDTVAESRTINLDTPAIKQAIAKGKKLIKDGKSKADAARMIFGMLEGEPKETIVAAFVAGATLTEKGALTYWYNCKRRASKQPKA